MYPEMRVTGETEFNRRGNTYNTTNFIFIDGQKVMGTVFWEHQWLPGILSLADGRKINVYKYRYDVYHQTIHFLNGSDSLEITDPVIELALIEHPGDTARFVNSDQFDKKATPVYYEVLADNDRGELLKLNQLKIGELNDAGLPTRDSKKVFLSNNSYYYYDKQKKKLARLKSGNSNIAQLMNVQTADLQGPQLKDLDIAKEEGLIAFVKTAALLPQK
ncbi:MAG: hypothetical protein DI535_25010 [Citrobacter freundii]|nr:MAG: hypothetical protein DI535_25010 [Citrobacter freundii]